MPSLWIICLTPLATLDTARVCRRLARIIGAPVREMPGTGYLVCDVASLPDAVASDFDVESVLRRRVQVPEHAFERQHPKQGDRVRVRVGMFRGCRGRLQIGEHHTYVRVDLASRTLRVPVALHDVDVESLHNGY